jgi:polysaccharide export outer membrane protein
MIRLIRSSIALAFLSGAVALTFTVAGAQSASPGIKTPSGATTVPTGPTASPSGARASAPSPTLSEPPGPTGTTGAVSPLRSDYIIGPGDVLQITVWKNDTLSRTVPVRPDGKVSMPLLHDVQASGLTAMQLRDKISTALGEFMPNPEVAVSVNDVRSLRVSILGEVSKPGVLELRGQTTILEAIAMAGGFKDFASPSKITILRIDENGKTKRIRFNYNRAVANSGDEENLILRSGDVVVVP